MSRLVRWVVTLVAAVAAFVLFLWLARSASFGWLPEAEADRWVVAAAFATVGAGAAAAAVGWWAGREEAPVEVPRSGTEVTQTANVSGQGRATQVGGNQNTVSPGPAGPDGPRTAKQDATVSEGGQATQVAGDQHTDRPEV